MQSFLPHWSYWHESGRNGQRALNLSPRLYIYVDAFDEGIAGWSVSITELFIIAKTLNAALVEPCIEVGQLRTCDGANEKLRLSDIFEMNKLKGYHPHFITYEEFQNVRETNKDSMYWFQGCTNTYWYILLRACIFYFQKS